MFWLLSMLASRDREEMSRTLLAMSSSQESCIAMRKSGCVPLLVQILHEGGTGEAAGTGGYSREARSRASAALHNIVYSQPDEGQARREMRVLHVLEQIRSHCENGWDWIENHLSTPSPGGGKTTGEPWLSYSQCVISCKSYHSFVMNIILWFVYIKSQTKILRLIKTYFVDFLKKISHTI